MDFSSEDLSEEGTSALFGSTVGKAFISGKESFEVGFPRAAKRLESARQPRERALPGR
jgi:hypothetical protein